MTESLEDRLTRLRDQANERARQAAATEARRAAAEEGLREAARQLRELGPTNLSEARALEKELEAKLTTQLDAIEATLNG